MNCPYCNERTHARHWCLRTPENWQLVNEWMQAQASGGAIIPRNQYIAIAKMAGMPSATTLEKQVAGTWQDVAAAFGLTAGKAKSTQKSRLDQPVYHYDPDRDELPAVGLAVLPTPRIDTWYSPRDGRWYSGLAWGLR